MKIYISHSTNFDYVNELYAPIKSAAMRFGQHRFILPHDSGRDFNSKSAILNSDLMLAEVSHPSTGQGIELGWAEGRNVRIGCIHRNEAVMSSALSYVCYQFEPYNNTAELLDCIDRIIKIK